MNEQTLKDGCKLNVVITLKDCELITYADVVSIDKLRDMILNDPAYGLKSIITGIIDTRNIDRNHDTEIVWDNVSVEISVT